MTPHLSLVLDKAAREELYVFTARVFDALHPTDRFVPAWHIEAMCHEMMEVVAGRQSRLLITVPPRHLKSITVSVAFTAWLLGRDPAHRIIVASYGDELASKHGSDCRLVMDTPWYQRLFPRTTLSRRVATDLQTTQNGMRKAVSLGGAATGFGADIILIDDMMKAADAASPTERQRVRDYYDNTLVSRLNDKRRGAIVAIQQRLHEDDLAAYLIEKGFKHLNLPAIAEEDEVIALRHGRTHYRAKNEALFPEREPRETLEVIRRSMGGVAFAAQYQQNPVAPEGNRFRWEWVKTYDAAQTPERSDLPLIVQSWDTATTTEPHSAFSVCTTWGLPKYGWNAREGAWDPAIKPQWLLLEVERDRLDYPTLKTRVISNQKRWRADKVLIECASSGLTILQEIERMGRSGPVAEQRGTFVPIKPTSSKEERLDAQTVRIEEGEALFPSHASWMPALKQELLAFPRGTYDDQVDSLSQFLLWMSSQRADNLTVRKLTGKPPPRPRSITGRRYPGQPRR
ncbi:phage terminase large subunit [Mesorhizobium sp. RP14(2022)]|uniref:Phage terminase large subunit n=1 Tax=Mesorhizobium liriopis TaxID=2953882 RepID=A0ABT1C6X2_9HYPH|nr:phage terminase large subunit [Mesorhizobium liriopis]MCO6050512.1 phage terminase large subunit [Mesorhizobium liriopis]